jgi:hypothetical protein
MQAAFKETRESLVERPWAVDDLQAVLQRFQGRQYRKALLFVDNAGSDVVLGKQLLYLIASPSHCLPC